MKIAVKLLMVSFLTMLLNCAYAQSDMQHNGMSQDSMRTNGKMSPDRRGAIQPGQNDSTHYQRTMPNNRTRRDSINTSPNNKMYNKSNAPSTVPPDSTHK